jgi:hypothetical protein
MNLLHGAGRTPFSVTVGKGRLIAFGSGMAVLLAAAISISSCRKSVPAPVNSNQPQSKPQATEARVLSDDEQSCKDLVQNFYDWYWNQYADKINDPNFKWPNDPNAERRMHQFISKEIFQVMDNYEKQVKANHDGGNSVLEYWDPYINENQTDKKYIVVQVEFSGDRCLATVRGSTVVQPELKRVGKTWIIVNFHYPDAKSKSDSSLIDYFSKKN